PGVLRDQKRTRLDAVDDERAEQERHDDVRWNAERQQRNEGAARRRIVRRLRPGDALDGPLAEHLRPLGELALERIGSKRGNDRATARQHTEEEAEDRAANDGPLRVHPILRRWPEAADAGGNDLAI